MGYTPGPWRFTNNKSCGNAIEGYSGQKLFEEDDGYRTVAIYMAAESSGKHIVNQENQKANGYLIAAAPDLFEALEMVLRIPDFDGTNKTSKIRMAAKRQARLALKKAKGLMK